MDKFCLNGKWKLYFNVEKGVMPKSLAEVKKVGWSCIESHVPGNVELDLYRAGIEQDPFYSQNIYNFRKYEFYQWWYEREFEIPDHFKGKNIILKLNGLDNFGTIWINGVLCGSTDNMFIEHEVDITSAVRIGEVNHIAIRIESAINKVRNKEFPINIIGGEYIDEMVWLRKPPHSFGWDIAPRFISAGLWRSVEILARDHTYIKEVYYVTAGINNDTANLLVKYRFATDETFIDDFSVRIKGICGDNIFEKEYATNFCSGGVRVKIPNVKLWWPKGYGDPNLYDMTFELLHKGEVIDRRCEHIGIRKIDIQTAYEEGDLGEFKILVNDVPILAKGSNWVPLDAFHSRDKDRLKTAHDMLNDLGCNIIRCWGGNVYEDHDFYDLCDERGMMVWQDFAMACAVYPQNDEFAGIIEKEATSVVKKLRNHPSIILWAGDNEVDQVYYFQGYNLPSARYNRMTREVLPRVIGSHDPYRAFIPSSPYIPEHLTGDLSVPEQHNWGPRDYFKGDFYKHTSAHFISEIGYHGCPAVSSIKKFIPEDKLWPLTDNDDWDTHNTDYIRISRRGSNRNELMANQVRILFGFMPHNIEDFALASQISQAEAKKFFIEMVRMKKWRRTGLIWWNLLDCWPQISDAVVDYYFTKKIAYHYIKRVQNPICIMISELENWSLKVILGNDSNRSKWVEYCVYDGETDEKILSGKKYSIANENMEIGSIPSLAGEQKMYIIKWTIDGKEYGNHYISGYVPFDFEKYKDWLKKIEKLPQPFDSSNCYL